MNYQKISLLPKINNKEVILTDLIKNKRFNEIINLLTQKSTLTAKEQYIYGYSLLQTEQDLKALIIFWQLVLKGFAELKAECIYIMKDLFKEEEKVAAIFNNLAEKDLYTIMFMVKELLPNTKIEQLLRQKLFNFLWQKHDYANLERILKLYKKEMTAGLVENLSKVIFAQAELKLAGNIAGFVGYVLSGGACLILKNSIYHNDLVEEITALAVELKLLFSRLKLKQPLAWDLELFDNFVDYETKILIEVLNLAVQNKEHSLDFVATPSYIINYHAEKLPLVEKFLNWLNTTNQQLAKVYNIDFYNAVVWAFGGNKLFKTQDLLKLIAKNNFNSELKLALYLRAISLKKPYLIQLATTNDFIDLKNSNNLFKNILIHTVKLIHKELGIDHQKIWQILLKFNQIFEISEIKMILIKSLTNRLNNEYRSEKNLDLITIKNMVQQLKDYKFIEQINSLYFKQQQCFEFLNIIKDPRVTNQIIKKIKNQVTLNNHLELIANSFILIAKSLSIELFNHIGILIVNNKINKLSNLKKFFDLRSLDYCLCFDCQKNVYKSTMPQIVKSLNLNVVKVPEGSSYEDLDNKPLDLRSSKSILAAEDPFEILGINPNGSKLAIMQQVMKLIKEFPEKMAIFRQAQSELFNSGKRFLHHYFKYLSEVQNLNEQDLDDSIFNDFPLTKIIFRDQF
jgi:hypothetical protein